MITSRALMKLVLHLRFQVRVHLIHCSLLFRELLPNRTHSNVFTSKIDDWYVQTPI